VSLRAAIGALALAGAGIAAYLAYVKLAGSTAVCPTSGCETVQRSRYSELGGIPVSLLGLVAYLTIFATALLRHPAALVAGAAVALSGVAFGAYLLALQLWVIDAVCVWCAASDCVVGLLAVLTVLRARSLDHNERLYGHAAAGGIRGGGREEELLAGR
jgi:uncharacterized membrane protein